jgi:hypothetical protein
VEAAPSASRCRRAGLPTGSRHEVVASRGEHTKALSVYLGRVPLVVSFEPARGGWRATSCASAGAGFAPSADGNAVTFDGIPALVVAASAVELAVVLPPVRPQPRRWPGGRSAGEKDLRWRLLPAAAPGGGHLGAALPRGAVGEGGARGQATVGTEIAPVLLLSWKDESRSVGERALQVAAALNAAVDRARVGQAAAFEAREQPADRRGDSWGARPAPARDAAGRRGLRDAPRAARARRPAHPDRPRPALGRPPRTTRSWSGRAGAALGHRRSSPPRRGPPSPSSARRCPGSTAAASRAPRGRGPAGELKRRLREVALRVP